MMLLRATLVCVVVVVVLLESSVMVAAQFSPALPMSGGNSNLPSSAATIAENLLRVPQMSLIGSMLRSPPFADLLGLLNDPTPKTFFAPANQAFAAMQIDPTKVQMARATLLFHVLPAVVPASAVRGLLFHRTMLTDPAFVNLGNGVPQNMQLFNDGSGLRVYVGPTGDTKYMATVVTTLQCSNGLIHVIDRVLAFPRSAAETAQRGGLNEMLDRLVREGLLPTAEQTTALTLFAPTNEAFQAFASYVHSPAGRELRIDFARVLRAHLVPGVWYSTALDALASGGGTLTTLDGRHISIQKQQGKLMLDGGAALIPSRTNTLVKNGVVHVIDHVLFNDLALPASAMTSRGPQ